MTRKVISFFLLFCSLLGCSQPKDHHEWLEEDSSSKVAEWVDSQDEKTQEYLTPIPNEEALFSKLKLLHERPIYGLPDEREGTLFFTSRGYGESHFSLMVQSPNGDVSTLFKPELYSPISGFVISNEGKLAAIGTASNGSDQQVWQVIDTSSKELLPVSITGIQFSPPVWDTQDQGVYYIKDREEAIFYQPLGKLESRLIYSFKEEGPRQSLSGLEMLSDTALLVHTSFGCTDSNNVFLIDLETAKAEEILSKDYGHSEYIGQMGEELLFLSNHEASRSKIVTYKNGAIRDFIPETSDTLVNAALVEEKLICHYLKDCVAEVKRFDSQSLLIDSLSLPGSGTVMLSSRAPYYGYTDFATPYTVYHYEKGKTFENSRESVPGVVTTQGFATSKDGTKVSYFITYKKGLDLNCPHPTLLYGYGGFLSSVTPTYTPLRQLWVEQGGIYVTANLRGGGEYGKAWHEAGILDKKQNVFDDFIAVAESLIEDGYTTQKQLAINGGSNGGLLVGACITQRPDLFGAAIPQVGVLDMLKFHKHTVGWAWMSDYGNPDKKEDAKYLLRYSPYHNVKEGVSYPPTLITTGAHDDRVVPFHSFKFAARLQEVQKSQSPILLRVYKNTGHGMGRSSNQHIEMDLDLLRFLNKTIQSH